ncbi:MAG TPA: hypothetical protein VGD17_20520 [Chitinophagaceae bacterium]
MMDSIVFWIVLTVVLFILFVILLIKAIISRKKSWFVFTGLVLLLTIAASAFSAWIIGKKSIDLVQDTFEPRSGNEIYAALFGNSTENCVRVINHKDQAPILDCCIWLQFQTCPAELRRILAQGDFAMTTVSKDKIGFHDPKRSEEPTWFNPQLLGDSILIFRYSHTKTDREQMIYSSTDSTMVYYYDMTY